MKSAFTKTINGHEYQLQQVGYPKITKEELVYHITFYNDNLNKKEEFRMKFDGSMWKFQAQALPDYVWDAELELNDAIEENQNS